MLTAFIPAFLLVTWINRHWITALIKHYLAINAKSAQVEVEEILSDRVDDMKSSLQEYKESMKLHATTFELNYNCCDIAGGSEKLVN